MTDSYLRIRSAIQSGLLGGISPDEYEDPVYRRLVDGIVARLEGRPVGDADLAVLIRHFIAREDARSSGARTELSLPDGTLWPAPDMLARAGLSVARLSGRVAVRVEPWAPSWLSGSADVEPGAAATAEVLRRSYEPVPGDPFLSAAGHPHYRSVGQREAVRAVLSMEAGSTLVINLPTGAGKSLCAHLPVLLNRQGGGLSVIVVPTTALAIDQERAMSRWLGHPTAFFGDEAGSERRRGILERVYDGTQRVIFTSPEALLGSLRSALYSVASQGGLRFLVVDEAHIVEQWGDGFRSAFQEIGGLRTDLLRVCPAQRALRTVLMTATLTSESLATLSTLFGKESLQDVLSASQLRPEPEYWTARAASNAVRDSWVLEAVHRLPRSVILYVTTPDEAESWRERLCGAGFLRCRSVTGKTPTAEREKVIRGWQAREIDIVVATSAFGVGMDQPDVRTVIHACVPENIDRFYQEVGRGGRDGRASVSLLVYTDADREVAARLNKTTIIGIARGRERWSQMFSDPRREVLGQGRYSVPIDVVPSFREEDIAMVNERNVEWNARTLTLMSRAGLIELDCVRPTGAAANAPTDRYPTRVVRILNEEHLDEGQWMSHVEPERRRSYQRDVRAFTLMEGVLQGDNCYAEIFEQAYTIVPSASESVTRTIRVARSCGGCPACRRRRVAPYAGAMPQPLPIQTATVAIGGAIAALARGRSMTVFWDVGEEERAISLLWWAASQGFRNVVISDVLLDTAVRGLSESRAAEVVPFVTPLSEYHPYTAAKVPTVLLVCETDVPDHILASPNGRDPVQRMLLLRNNSVSTDLPERRLREVAAPPRFSLSEIEATLAL